MGDILYIATIVSNHINIRTHGMHICTNAGRSQPWPPTWISVHFFFCHAHAFLHCISFILVYHKLTILQNLLICQYVRLGSICSQKVQPRFHQIGRVFDQHLDRQKVHCPVFADLDVWKAAGLVQQQRLFGCQSVWIHPYCSRLAPPRFRVRTRLRTPSSLLFLSLL